MSVPDSDRSPARRSPARQLLRLSVILAIAAVGYFIWISLGVWAKHGLDFSVYWYGGKILNDAGAAPSDLYAGNVDWAGGPTLMFTYPPFAAILFGLLARLPQAAALTLFNAAGAGVAILTAVRAVRYWNAKASWRATFRIPGNGWAAAVLVLAVLNLGPWRETLVFGQINALLMGLIAVDLLARNQRWTRGFPGSGFLVGVAAGIKLTPLVFGLYYLVRRDWRGLGNMAAGFTATVAGRLAAASRRIPAVLAPDAAGHLPDGGSGLCGQPVPQGCPAALRCPGGARHCAVAGAEPDGCGRGRRSDQGRQRSGRPRRGRVGDGPHHAADQPGLVVPPLGVGRGRLSGFRLDPAGNPAPLRRNALDHGRRAGHSRSSCSCSRPRPLAQPSARKTSMSRRPACGSWPPAPASSAPWPCWCAGS